MTKVWNRLTTVAFTLFIFLPSFQTQQWGEWSDFGPCSKTCGNGVKLRTRECELDYDYADGCEVGGTDSETIICKLQECSVGRWGDWGSFGPCSKTCGDSSIKTKTRKCVRVSLGRGENLANECTEGTVQSHDDECDVEPCIIDGGWGPWSEEWSECESRNCWVKNGIRYKYRLCDNPLPANGGKMCQGPLVKVHPCNEPVNCPIDGGWSEWSNYTCVKEDDVYLMRRTRNCTNPAPKYGGFNCDFGGDVEIIYREFEMSKFEKHCPGFAKDVVVSSTTSKDEEEDECLDCEAYDDEMVAYEDE